MLHKPTVCSVFVSLLYGQHSSMVERVKKLGCESCRVYVTIDGVECIEYIQRILRHLYFFRDIKKNTRVNIMEQNCIFITSGGFRGGAPPPYLVKLKKIAEEKKAGRASDTKPGPPSLRFASTTDNIAKQLVGHDQYLEEMWRHVNSIQTVFKVST